MASIKLTRMNGLGNDFLIYDARKQDPISNFTEEQVIHLSSRANKQTGGCDQFIVLKNPPHEGANVFMLIYNSDGSEVHACGNASRCVTALISKEIGKDSVSIETKAGLLNGTFFDPESAAVNMGAPVFEWKKIPLSKDVDIKNIPVELAGFSKPFAVSMGNPHMVFTTDMNVDNLDVPALGTPLEHHELFPQRVNVGFAQIVDKHNINLRVFERGAGETLACGTGACAAAVAAITRGLCQSPVDIRTRGGNMTIEWNGNHSPVIMTGAAVFEKVVDADI